jgi:hypothetical protein
MRVLVWACESHLSRRSAQMKLTPLYLALGVNSVESQWTSFRKPACRE